MNILLVYPNFPDTFWSFKHALKFVGKRAALPPLGLLTVAAMLPQDWSMRLLDMNVCEVTEEDLAWADCAFISAMIVQRESAQRIAARLKKAALRVVAGGPLFTNEYEKFTDIDHFILNEAELTLPPFLEDLARGCPKRIYSSSEFADMRETPTPRWDLLNLKQYASMSIQFTRGCPFDCDFCNVTALLGRQVRMKTSDQIIAELDGLSEQGWHGDVFFVDDNFIGNKKFLKNDLLPALIDWREKKTGYIFYTEASINLADDQELMDMMISAGFGKVFVGIETPDNVCLAECGKGQNENRDLVEDVKRIQRNGLQVQGGFIVGFDADKPSIFQRQINFIQKSGIVTAMVGLLQAPAGTRLYDRMEREGRLCQEFSGDNVDGTSNIIPLMNRETLQDGYRQILNHIYSPKHYYKRIRTFLREYRPPTAIRGKLEFSHLLALLRSFYLIGIVGRERFYYWKLLLWAQFRNPRLFPQAVILAIYGYHFRKVCETHVK